MRIYAVNMMYIRRILNILLKLVPYKFAEKESSRESQFAFGESSIKLSLDLTNDVTTSQISEAKV